MVNKGKPYHSFVYTLYISVTQKRVLGEANRLRLQAYRLNVWGALIGKDRLLRFQRTTQSSGTSSALQCGISFHHHHHGWLCQGCTNPGHQVARATKFCTVAPNICGSSVWYLLDVTVLMQRNFVATTRLPQNLCTPTL